MYDPQIFHFSLLIASKGFDQFWAHIASLILRPQIDNRMSKLQKYLSTPRLKHSHFLSFEEGGQDQPFDIPEFPEQLLNPQVPVQNQDIPSEPPENIQVQQRIMANQRKLPVPQIHKQTINKQLNFNDQSFEDQMKTPKKKSRRNYIQKTTHRKKYQLRESHQEHSSINEMINGEWTLKNLAVFAYKAVVSIGPTNYKSVAEHIIKEYTKSDEQIDANTKSNIKRRVYDALNVLIALGKLEKKGRNIFKNIEELKAEEMREKKKQHYILQIQKRKMIIKEAQQVLDKVNKSSKNLQQLINRNKVMNNPGITFPLIAFPSSQIQLFKFNEKALKIRLTNPESFCAMGDLDLMNMMEL